MPQRLVDVGAVQAISRPASMRAHEESPVPTLGAEAAFRVADEAAAKPPSTNVLPMNRRNRTRTFGVERSNRGKFPGKGGSQGLENVIQAGDGRSPP
jgi:hypothetical protein